MRLVDRFKGQRIGMARGALLGLAVALAFAVSLGLAIAVISILKLWTIPFLILVGFVVMGALVGKWANEDCRCGHSKLQHHPIDTISTYCRECGPPYGYGRGQPKGCARFNPPEAQSSGEDPG